MMLDLLPDLCDLNPDQFTLLDNSFSSFGTKRIFYGEAVTVRCFEDNSRVKEQLATPGKGKVLVVDGGGSIQRALMGDMIALSAMEHGWEGVVINGAIRDVAAINRMALGVKALAACPIKTERKGFGEAQIPLHFSGAEIHPGNNIYADENGIIVSSRPLQFPE